jgi:hypothetical protein
MLIRVMARFVDPDQHMEAKREVLDAWAIELRRIIGEPVQAKGVDTDLRLAA